MVAAKAGHLNVVKYLVDNGALIEAETINGVRSSENSVLARKWIKSSIQFLFSKYQFC